MDRLISGAVLLSVLVPVTPAIAQTELLPPESPTENIDTLLPADSTSSADLITEPATASSSTLFDSSPSDMSNSLQDFQIEASDADVTERGTPGDQGPASSDQVQFVLY